MKSLAVIAFMNVLNDRRSMLKNGSLTGNFSLPHNTVCSNTCATPVESRGVVRNATLNPAFESSAPTCSTFAPVFTCSSSTATTSYGITRFVDVTSNAPPASLVPGFKFSSASSVAFASSLVARFVAVAVAFAPPPPPPPQPPQPPPHAKILKMPNTKNSILMILVGS